MKIDDVLVLVYVLGVVMCAGASIYFYRDTPTKEIPNIFPLFLMWPIAVVVLLADLAWDYFPRWRKR